MTIKKILYFFIFPSLFIQFIGAFFYFVALEGTHLSQIIYTLTKILIIVWPIYWILKKQKLTVTKNHKYSILSGVLSGLAIATLILSIFTAFFGYFSQFADEIIMKIHDFGIGQYYILFALFLSIAHSGIEEYYWRWFIFKGLQIRFKPLTAAIISSIGFASHHFIILSQFFNAWITITFGLAVFIGGLVWCFIYHKTNSSLGNWISHIFVDLAIMTIGYILIF